MNYIYFLLEDSFILSLKFSKMYRHVYRKYDIVLRLNIFCMIFLHVTFMHCLILYTIFSKSSAVL